jgi:hypothetical protein
MPHRLAASLALLSFAACLFAGGVHAGNPFGTTIQRALLAMAGTYVIGLIVGAMGQKMIEENVKAAQKKLLDSRTEAGRQDR